MDGPFFSRKWSYVGVDLGQVRDPTALAVIDAVEKRGDWDPVSFGYRWIKLLQVRYLQRLALGTPYPEVVERVRQVVQTPELWNRCEVVADATGVGRPVIDMLRRARLGCGLEAVTITAGDRETRDGEYHGVPKRDLIVGVQALLQQEALQMADGLAEGPVLVKEMMDMQVRVGAGGREQYGAWREGAHDDLVLAVALAAWRAMRRGRV